MTQIPLQHLSDQITEGSPVGVVQQEVREITDADRLWAALEHAKADDRPLIRAHTEDAVFRYYQPVARALAQSSSRYPQDPEGAEQAAELGLAQAVLAWRRPCGQGFERTAEIAISTQLRHLPGRVSAPTTDMSR